MIVISQEHIQEAVPAVFTWQLPIRFFSLTKYKQDILDDIHGCIVRDMTCRILDSLTM